MTFAISILGFYTGIYTLLLLRKSKIKLDRVLVVNFSLLGLLNIYMGALYLLVNMGVISNTPASELSPFIRPANLLLILVPFLISKRMGL